MQTDNSQQSKQVILSRIRHAVLPQAAHVSPEQGWTAIPREFRRSGRTAHDEVLSLFSDRLRDYDAQVISTTQVGVAKAIEQMFVARGVKRILLPTGFPAPILPEGFEYIWDEALSWSELDSCDCVISTCTVAIAETGTIVLQNAPGQGRRAASLIPDYHLCLVEASRVLATVPEAVAALRDTASLPTTFISGPSATADIEMTRIKGVHGPRFLDVIVIT